MTRAEFAFFTDSLEKYFDSAFLLQDIDSLTCQRLKSWCKTAEARQCAERLFSKRIVEMRKHRLRLQLKSLREMNGEEFNHIEVFVRPRKRPKRRCFVGHRFLPGVNDTLRWNLRQVLEPYNVQLDWSGRDIRSVQILEDIVRRIKVSDFCVFDKPRRQREA